MQEKYVVRQLVKCVAGNKLVDVSDSQFERPARMDYDNFSNQHPSEYFELVRVRMDEECLAHNGKPA